MSENQIEQLRQVLDAYEKNQRAWRKLRWLALGSALALFALAVHDARSMQALTEILDYSAQGLNAEELTTPLAAHVDTVNAQIRNHFLAVLFGSAALWIVWPIAVYWPASTIETAAVEFLRSRMDSIARLNGPP